KAFKAKYGPKAVVGDVTQAAYLGPWLWKAAVEKAGSFDVAKVTAASKGRRRKHEGLLSSMKYFQSLNNPNNAAFVKSL
ncbi:hypothetical protein EKL28_18200, partial [Staphylococcus aureus]